MLQEDGGNALWRLFSNSSSEKRERILTAAAGIPRKHEWMDETLRTFMRLG